jgi:adhesin/invasin
VIGSTAATVSFAGLAPGWVGLVQVNLVVPAGLATGTYPLTVTIDGQTSNAGNISVQ